MRIRLKGTDGRDTTIDIEKDDSVNKIREFISCKSGAESSRVRLVYAGQLLGQNDKICDHNIGENDTIHVVIRPEGFPASPTVTPDANNPAIGDNVRVQPLQQMGNGVFMGAITIDGTSGNSQIEQILGSLLRLPGLSVAGTGVTPSVGGASSNNNSSSSSSNSSLFGLLNAQTIPMPTPVISSTIPATQQTVPVPENLLSELENVVRSTMAATEPIQVQIPPDIGILSNSPDNPLPEFPSASSVSTASSNIVTSGETLSFGPVMSDSAARDSSPLHANMAPFLQSAEHSMSQARDLHAMLQTVNFDHVNPTSLQLRPLDHINFAVPADVMATVIDEMRFCSREVDEVLGRYALIINQSTTTPHQRIARLSQMHRIRQSLQMYSGLAMRTSESLLLYDACSHSLVGNDQSVLASAGVHAASTAPIPSYPLPMHSLLGQPNIAPTWGVAPGTHMPGHPLPMHVPLGHHHHSFAPDTMPAMHPMPGGPILQQPVSYVMQYSPHHPNPQVVVGSEATPALANPLPGVPQIVPLSQQFVFNQQHYLMQPTPIQQQSNPPAPSQILPTPTASLPNLWHPQVIHTPMFQHSVLHPSLFSPQAQMLQAPAVAQVQIYQPPIVEVRQPSSTDQVSPSDSIVQTHLQESSTSRVPAVNQSASIQIPQATVPSATPVAQPIPPNSRSTDALRQPLTSAPAVALSAPRTNAPRVVHLGGHSTAIVSAPGSSGPLPGAPQRLPRNWHRAEDAPQRRVMTLHIINMLKQINNRPEAAANINMSAINLELDLYFGADCYHDYANATTLQQRVLDLLQQRNQQQMQLHQQEHNRIASLLGGSSSSVTAPPCLALEAPSETNATVRGTSTSTMSSTPARNLSTSVRMANNTSTTTASEVMESNCPVSATTDAAHTSDEPRGDSHQNAVSEDIYDDMPALL